MLTDKSRRRLSGGKRKPHRKKRKAFRRRYTLDCKIGDKKVREVDVRGNNSKLRLQQAEKVNVTDPETGECEMAEIKDVVESPANETLARRNIITKGSIVETDKGKVEITSRPGQEGNLNGKKLE